MRVQSVADILRRLTDVDAAGFLYICMEPMDIDDAQIKIQKVLPWLEHNAAIKLSIDNQLILEFETPKAAYLAHARIPSEFEGGFYSCVYGDGKSMVDNS